MSPARPSSSEVIALLVQRDDFVVVMLHRPGNVFGDLYDDHQLMASLGYTSVSRGHGACDDCCEASGRPNQCAFRQRCPGSRDRGEKIGESRNALSCQELCFFHYFDEITPQRSELCLLLSLAACIASCNSISHAAQLSRAPAKVCGIIFAAQSQATRTRRKGSLACRAALPEPFSGSSPACRPPPTLALDRLFSSLSQAEAYTLLLQPSSRGCLLAHLATGPFSRAITSQSCISSPTHLIF
jgi:hypothetical protein